MLFRRTIEADYADRSDLYQQVVKGAHELHFVYGQRERRIGRLAESIGSLIGNEDLSLIASDLGTMRREGKLGRDMLGRLRPASDEYALAGQEYEGVTEEGLGEDFILAAAAAQKLHRPTHTNTSVDYGALAALETQPLEPLIVGADVQQSEFELV